MNTRISPVTEESLGEAGALIRAGGLVAFPTETVYGLGANALDGTAVQGIFEAKGRPGDNPLIVHIASLDQADALIDGPMPAAARRLAEAFWPGPLTMVMRKSRAVPDEVSAGLDTVGIRLPSHRAARALSERARVPIAAPSANRSGRPSPTTAQHVLIDMDGRIPLILDGGPCAVGLESTVLDVICDPPRVLRPGGVTAEMIAEHAHGVELDGSILRPLKRGEVARSPGMKYRHYAPEARMTIVQGARAAERIAALYDEAEAAGETPCVLALAGHRALYGDRRMYSLGEDAVQAAAKLFAALRKMDERGVTRIFAEAVDAEGLGLAVMNRMGRAAAFDLIDTDGEAK
ncbi:MAG: L-threonylcarbamoyladenylate synthase [Christensenellaceae bacterium]|nr:L-threonylcarbamoyladenylate synthase [Christensenellaceae bacterium]